MEVGTAGQPQVGGKAAHAKHHARKALAPGDVDVDMFVDQGVFRVYFERAIRKGEGR